jgi:hypothetical protein
MIYWETFSNLGQCSTSTYTKSNGAIACGFDIAAGLNGDQARSECAKIGARLPEIADDRENSDLFNRKVRNYYYS